MRNARNIVRPLARLAPLAAAALVAAGPTAAAAATLAVATGAPTNAVTGVCPPATSACTAWTSNNKPAAALTLTATGGTVTVNTIRASIASGVAGVNVKALQLWIDADNSGTVTTGDTLLATASWSPNTGTSPTGRYVFTGFSQAVTTSLNLLVTVGVGVPYVNGSSYGAASSSGFTVSVAAADVLSDASSTSGSASGPAFTITSSGTLPEGSNVQNTNAPVIIILNPGDGATVSPTPATATPANAFRVQFQVYSPNGSALTSVQLSTDNGSTWPLAPSVNANYASVVGANAFIYESNLTVCASGCTFTMPGIYTLRAHATNSGTGGGGPVNSAAVVIAVGKSGAGDGNLLVRDNSSQLCIDCHAILPHSSQAIKDSRYGSWSTTCRDCHTPHRTNNIYLLKSAITPPAVSGFQSARKVNFATKSYGYAGTTTSFGQTAFTNGDNSGPCQVCHTRTKSSTGTARWQNTGNSDSHYNAVQSGGGCISCHTHDQGFQRPPDTGGGESPGGVNCSGCHSSIWSGITTAPAGSGSAHLLGATAGLNDVFADNTSLSWGNPLSGNAPSSRTCADMCHGDHTHELTTPAVGSYQLHQDNVFINAQSYTSRGENGGSSNQVKNGPGGTSPITRDATDYQRASSPNAPGMCISCHQNPISASKPAISASAYDATAHNFTTNAVGATNYVWQYTFHDGGAFARNCTKCHAATPGASTAGEGTSPTYAAPTIANFASGLAAVHYSPNPSLLAGKVNAAGGGSGTLVCYNCHGSGTSGTQNLNLSGKNIAGPMANTFRHPVDTDNTHNTVAEAAATYNNGQLAGTNRHVNCLDCHNPHQAQPVGAGATAGQFSAVSTATTPWVVTDANSGKAWTVNQWKGYTIRIVGGLGVGLSSTIYANTNNTLSVLFPGTPPVVDTTSKYVITANGLPGPVLLSGTQPSNLPTGSGTQVGAWGVAPTFANAPAPVTWDQTAGCGATGAHACEELYGTLASTATYTTVATGAVPEAYLCVKCHASFAYGTGAPASPPWPNLQSGGPNGANTIGATTIESDVVSQFNPNNLGHHAVFARGKNQPIQANWNQAGVTSYHNASWPIYVGTGSLSISGGLATYSGTLPSVVIPGWYLYVSSAAFTAPPASVAGSATTGYLEITAIGPTANQFTVRALNGTGGWVAPTFTASYWGVTAGLGNTFVPPYGPWSVISCTDCHRSSTQSDPLGPHGSATKWLLRSAEKQNFAFYNGTSVVAVATTPYATPPTGTINVFCQNCHRYDVYGDAGVTITPRSPVCPSTANVYCYTRQFHPADYNNTKAMADKTGFMIPCMNCHGGARIGAIHGENLGQGKGGTSWTAGSYSGKRLLGGSAWIGVTRSTTTVAGKCYVGATLDAVDTCAAGHLPQTFASPANYTYDDTSP